MALRIIFQDKSLFPYQFGCVLSVFPGEGEGISIVDTSLETPLTKPGWGPEAAPQNDGHLSQWEAATHSQWVCANLGQVVLQLSPAQGVPGSAVAKPQTPGIGCHLV